MKKQTIPLLARLYAPAAQFRQLENQIALFIDIAIASEMPVITPASSK